MRLFSPRKTTMLFVIRDKTRVHSFLFFLYTLQSSNILCFVDVIFGADAIGKLRACLKGRYSEGKKEVAFSLFQMIHSKEADQ